MQRSLRDWIRTQVPASRAALNASFPTLGSRLAAELTRIGVIGKEPQEPYTFTSGAVRRIQAERPAEDPDKLVILAGVDAGCGPNDAVLLFDYQSGKPRLILETYSKTSWGETARVQFSAPSSMDLQRVVTLRYPIQCGSSWYHVLYDVFELGANGGNQSAKIHEGIHGVWTGFGEDALQVRFAPHELRLDIRDRSIDAGIHNRAHVIRLQFAGGKATRVDPVALLPRDFVDEWLTQPWSVMESRTAIAERAELKRRHQALHVDLIFGEFLFVQHCEVDPRLWQIGVDFYTERPKQLENIYFLVRELGPQHYEMTAVDRTRQAGCPGKGSPFEEGH